LALFSISSRGCVGVFAPTDRGAVAVNLSDNDAAQGDLNVD
jgi:hypothetical protein